MNAEQIMGEYQRDGRISGKAFAALRRLLRDADDPYSAITLAGDVGAFQLGEDIVPYLSDGDSMVRWNAVGVLFTRFRDVRFASQCLELLDRESDSIVRGILQVGAGELLPLIEDRQLRRDLSARLLEVLQAEDELPEMRESAYLGIEAAVGIPLANRSPADRFLDPKDDFKEEVLREFREMYDLLESSETG